MSRKYARAVQRDAPEREEARLRTCDLIQSVSSCKLGGVDKTREEELESSKLKDIELKIGLATKSLERAQALTVARASKKLVGVSNPELDAIAATQLEDALDKVVELSERYCKALQEE